MKWGVLSRAHGGPRLEPDQLSGALLPSGRGPLSPHAATPGAGDWGGASSGDSGHIEQMKMWSQGQAFLKSALKFLCHARLFGRIPGPLVTARGVL